MTRLEAVSSGSRPSLVSLAAEKVVMDATGGDPARLDVVEQALWERLPAAPPVLEDGQYELRTRSYAPFATFGDLVPATPHSPRFRGDDRGPSASLEVTSRITQKTIVDAQGGSVVANTAASDPTRMIQYGIVIAEGTSQPRSGARAARTPIGVRIEQSFEGSNPLVPGAPDIDVDATVYLERRGNLLVVTGQLRGDQFPSAETLLTDARGQTILLGAFATPYGPVEGPVRRLPGDGQADMGRFELRVRLDPRGNFAGVEDPRTGRAIDVETWNQRVGEQRLGPG